MLLKIEHNLIRRNKILKNIKKNDLLKTFKIKKDQ